MAAAVAGAKGVGDLARAHPPRHRHPVARSPHRTSPATATARPTARPTTASPPRTRRRWRPCEDPGTLIAAFQALVARQTVPEWQESPGRRPRSPCTWARARWATGVSLGLRAGRPVRRGRAEDQGRRVGLGGSPSLEEAARRITVPVEFLLQWHDERPPLRGLALFDAFASSGEDPARQPRQALANSPRSSWTTPSTSSPATSPWIGSDLLDPRNDPRQKRFDRERMSLERLALGDWGEASDQGPERPRCGASPRRSSSLAAGVIAVAVSGRATSPDARW